MKPKKSVKYKNKLKKKRKKDKQREERERKRPVKVILLGQDGSGKTTMMRNLQRSYAKDEWTKERTSWRAVIVLNLVHGVNDVLKNLNAEMTESNAGCHWVRYDEGRPAGEFEEKYRRLQTRLVPLKQIEMELEKILGTANAPVRRYSIAALHTGSMIDSSNARKLPHAQ